MEIVFSADPHRMNWFRPDFPYAQVRTRPDYQGHSVTTGITSAVSTTQDGDCTRTTVTFTNESAAPFFARVGDFGITLPLADRYEQDANVQQQHRCNAHLFCGGTSSYVQGLRTSGDGPHLGLVLTKGSLAHYSIERDLDHQSNDRGCFILHPDAFTLLPGESAEVSWTIFPFVDRADFAHEVAKRARFLAADWSNYVLFSGETAELTIAPTFAAQNVAVNGQPVPAAPDGTYRFAYAAAKPGEQVFTVTADEQVVTTRILVKAPMPELLLARSLFIARHQQYAGPVPGLAGAYLVYDNESDTNYYNQLNDYNAGRERVAMGILIAEYLLAVQSGQLPEPAPADREVLTESLAKFAGFMARELVNEDTGEARNDFGDGSFFRLYNAPWYALFYLRLHELRQHALSQQEPRADHRELLIAARITDWYYDQGGARFYPIELHNLDLVRALAAAGLAERAAHATSNALAHADYVLDTGSKYPASEVNFEQSIVGPAADVLLQAHQLTADAKYLNGARFQLRILDQFQGQQPDYHLHEVAIRHWDGFWFGKRQLFGDTFPHHWSGITGEVLARYAKITGDADAQRRADLSRRGTLPMIFDNGRASCAYLFPFAVIGVPGQYYDPYANDQDWGLIFALRAHVQSQAG